MKCRLCGGNPEQIIDFGDHPLANALADTREAAAASPRFPLSLGFCQNCKLLQLNQTISPETLFSNYVWVTGTSKTTRAWADQFAAIANNHVASKIGCLQTARALEVASNDGTFLQALLPKRSPGVMGWEVSGVDPAANIAAMANEAGIPTACAFFDSNYADIVAGQFDFVFARNVVPHVPDPVNVLDGMRKAAKPTGIIAVEVHHAKSILEGLQYDSVYHEHMSYFGAHSLVWAMERAGMYPYSATLGPLNGGALVVWASVEPAGKDKSLLNILGQEELAGVNSVRSWLDWAAEVKLHQSVLRNTVASLGRMTAWGASARASTLVNTSGAISYISQFVDKSPLKHGKFMAGSGVPIVAPSSIVGQVDSLVTAWNFLPEIRNEFGSHMSTIVVPYPAVTVLANEKSTEPMNVLDGRSTSHV